jgi:methylmalonyl-CoA epimerase
MHPVAGIQRLHHVAFAVADLDEALERWLSLTGGRLELRRQMADQDVEAASIELSHDSALLELIAPLSETGSVGRFLQRRGEGLHHIAFAVADVEAALAGAAAAGMRLIDKTSRIGLHGVPIAFLHPATSGGVLTELVQADA